MLSFDFQAGWFQGMQTKTLKDFDHAKYSNGKKLSELLLVWIKELWANYKNNY